MKHYVVIGLLLLLWGSMGLVSCRPNGQKEPIVREQDKRAQDPLNPDRPAPAALTLLFVYGDEPEYDWSAYHFALKNSEAGLYAPYEKPILGRNSVEVTFGIPSLTEKPLMPANQSVKAMWGIQKSYAVLLTIADAQGKECGRLELGITENKVPVINYIDGAKGFRLCRLVQQSTPYRFPYFEVQFNTPKDPQ
ncbi:hypothetical protein [Porphyromonas circumdentaria]|uniref:Uncharacterized protein n=1 Tax=Porphyromonas circumdentaria TaxID=29524 RepID=A0A1T4LVM9_9PORP|nr:hypothetical protein [Porphyromonas circumdentaria]MBB6275412.1 hypothetical protein [Porphyromonas circumdentaria]SJZ58742.1 hypothetical protein SAMN02745171_00547 [Porphyromonas circumdentaria]